MKRLENYLEDIKNKIDEYGINIKENVKIISNDKVC